MQTVLENLEETYLQLARLLEDDIKGLIKLNTASREALCTFFENTAKNIMLLIIDETADVRPIDNRVYESIVNTAVYKQLCMTSQQDFMDKMYKYDIFHKEQTIGELIEKLQAFAPSLKVNVLGNNNAFNKIIVDDTYIDKVVLVGVEK